MCFFLVVGIPKQGSQDWGKSLPPDVDLWPTHYSELQAAYPDLILHNVGRGGCSCDFYKEPKEVNDKALRRKYKKKGWSADRIERLIEEQRNHESQAIGINKGVREWIASIADKDGSALVLVHWDSDPFPAFTDPSIVQSTELRQNNRSVVEERLSVIKGTANQAL